jgi:arginase
MRILLLCIYIYLAQIELVFSQEPNLKKNNTEFSNPKIGVVLQPYTARRGVDEISIAPNILYPKVSKMLRDMKIELIEKKSIDLTADEKKQYGVWHRLAMADAHLGNAVSPMVKNGIFTVGLLGNCNSSLGVLAGLQHSGPDSKPLKVGLIWIDAHGDFNTPETTLSGWLGGMPVSVASGQSLFRLRQKTGLNPPISTENIIMMGLRDVDPLEQELINNSQMTTISTKEMLEKSPRMLKALDRLSSQVDVIYLHIDLDILDATEIPGSFFEVQKGPTAIQLQDPIRFLMQNKKVKALGLSSFPTAKKGRKTSLKSAMTIFQAALKGLIDRGIK